MTVEAQLIAKIFAACLATTSNYDDLKRCVEGGAVENKIEWHCTYYPPVSEASRVCTDAVWAFEKLYKKALFNAAKKAAGGALD